MTCDKNTKHGQGRFYPSHLPGRQVVCLCARCYTQHLREVEAYQLAQLKAWGLL